MQDITKRKYHTHIIKKKGTYGQKLLVKKKKKESAGTIRLL